MRVQILHNQNERESFLRGYRTGDPLIRVYDDEPSMLIPYREDLIVGLEFIYEMNQYAGVRKPWYEDARSLAMGDVIVLGDRAFAIERIGFKELHDFEVPE